MSTQQTDLYQVLRQRALRALEVLGPLRIARSLLVDPTPSASRDAEFGLLTLECGAAGLYYAWLGGDQKSLPDRGQSLCLDDAPVAEILDFLLSDSDAERSLGTAALNACTAALFERAGFSPPDATNAFGGLRFDDTDILGMVGNFPPLVRQARARKLPVRIVEKKPHMVQNAENLVISLDPAVLNPCSKVVCTGSTLINHSLEQTLAACPRGADIVLLGPTVGCFPDDFFERGVVSLAGTAIADGFAAHDVLAAGGRLGDVSRKTVITPSDYPGFETLISEAARKNPGR